jgi:hypothetical protein
MLDKTKAIQDIDDVLAHKPSQSGTGGVSEMVALFHACIVRWTPPGSVYRDQASTAMEKARTLSKISQSRIDQELRGIVQALRADVAKDRIADFVTLVHQSLFDDYLKQAEYLRSEGWLQASVVIAGGTLEEHLRKLAAVAGIPLDKANGKPKTASALNDELAKQQVYSGADHSLLLGWIKIRNEAAHQKPEFKQRTEEEIRQMLAGIRSFVVRFPA